MHGGMKSDALMLILHVRACKVLAGVTCGADLRMLSHMKS